MAQKKRYHPVIIDSYTVSMAEQYLSEKDSVLRKVIEVHGPCKLSHQSGAPFEQLCISIIGQQLSVKAATRFIDVLERFSKNGHLKRFLVPIRMRCESGFITGENSLSTCFI